MKSQYFQRGRGIVMALALGIALGVRGASGCGDFRMPSNHFEGVSSQGYVSIWKQLDTLDLGDARVPILLGAQTYRKIPSGELGSGWIMPLFDSGIVQRDENTFDMITPDGTMDFFYRDGTDPNILLGSSGWTAEIQGSDIIVHSKCGSGWKMVFRQGKLDTLSKGNHELRIQRDPLNRPTGITENGVTRLALTRDEKTGLVSALEMNGKKYLFGYDGKPRIENVVGQNLVVGVEPSLHEITYPQEMGGKKETYDFAVTEKMLPELKITDTEVKERMIVWGTDGKILQDGEWAYKITPGSDARANAAIERTNPQKQMEYWFKDEERGQETTLSLDGTKTERSWFTSGILAGKLRSKEETKNGVIKNLYSAVYNEKAQRIRAVFPDGVVKRYQFSSEGKQESTFIEKDGKQICDSKFDEKGRPTLVHTENRRLEENKYNDSLQQQLIYVDGKLLAEIYTDPNGKWIKRTVYDAKTGVRKFSRWKEFNTAGNLVLERLSDEAGKVPDFIKKFEYDGSGKLVKEFNSRMGAFIIEQGTDGKFIRKLLQQNAEQIAPNKS